MKNKLTFTAILVSTVLLVIFSYLTNSRQKYPLLSKVPQLEEGWVHKANTSRLQNEVSTYLNNTKIPYSFYASHLQTGTPVKAQERDVSVAASLFKLPIAMDVMRQVDTGNLSLNKEFVIKEEFKDNRFGNLYKQPAGSYITVEEALRLSLVDSDNTALKVLKSLPIVRSGSDSVLDTLNINISYDSDIESMIDTQSYAQILRCLYFSCYLSKESSEKILELLEQSSSNGINTGLPKGIKVAHIGVSQSVKSDCGIVYVGNDDYIFCIMLETDSKKAHQITAKVSAMVYKSMTAE